MSIFVQIAQKRPKSEQVRLDLIFFLVYISNIWK